ncbi:hypothetical protein [Powai lake megavirus]|uniref:Nudix hydrolase domain-containing protein n=1 Tax=Powai lake megavirus TaxID=1842663 RepID=A0A167RJB8_9VIRU|nr:hypothetical protein QJ849_gp590 [Powai lake megavirus]ANB50752.1 hypothetical protein [Powai lake megavirus]
MIKSKKPGFGTDSLELKMNNIGKTLSIPVKKPYRNIVSSNSDWNDISRVKYNINTINNKSDLKTMYKNSNKKYGLSYANKPYDAINNCKSAGIIPYTIHDGKLLFLFQKAQNPTRKKDAGWNDFGGKQINRTETTAQIASREFSEETSCLFYLAEKTDNKSKEIYNLLKNNQKLNYDQKTIELLREMILASQKFYADKITEYVLPIYVSSKETYISYFVKVKYLVENDLPKAEDIHINYEDRYLRDCRWFTLDEILNLCEKDFHKRLQITRIQQRIIKYYEKGLFS